MLVLISGGASALCAVPKGTLTLAEKVARRLEARYGLPVEFVDETLTSATAESQLRETRTRATRKADVDALAAAIILQSYLDSLVPSTSPARTR